MARSIIKYGNIEEANAYKEALIFRRRAIDWSENQKKQWVLGKLRQVLIEAEQHCEYYKHLFRTISFNPRQMTTFEQFARIPILERSDVQAHQRKLLSSAAKIESLQWNATGGSSGTPVEIQMGPRERGWRLSGADYSMERINVAFGTRRALLWGHHLDPVQRDTLTDRMGDIVANRRWFDCLRLSEANLMLYHKMMEQYRPRCIVAYASALASLARTLIKQGIKQTSYPTRCIVTGAEKLYEEDREIIQTVFKVPIHERYGSRDVGDMGFQYSPERNNKYEVDWSLVLVEPLTATSESDIIITKLQADGTQMIRYRTDDVGLFPQGSKPGHPTFTLEKVIGRTTDRVYKRDGSWVHGIHFPHLIKEYPVLEFQVEQYENFDLKISLVFPTDMDMSERQLVTQNIERNLQNNLGDLNVKAKEVEAIERTKAGKWRPVVSRIKEFR
jgi:phenylacetate-CoA ligase